MTDQVDESDKFAFGRNWANFLDTVDQQKVVAAQQSLHRLLQVNDLTSKSFLDAGSGSGLFSLAAHSLGASVVSFDADPDSVACTRQLKSNVDEPTPWVVHHGSLLDADFLATLPTSDVVYCWGVAHHTGDMWRAIDNLTKLVTPGGHLVLAIYNDEQYISRAWHTVKRIYQQLPRLFRTPYVLLIWSAQFIRRAIVTLFACVLRLVTFRNPLTPILNWIGESRTRGMNSWHDLVDWIGGWPFEVARPEEIFRYVRDRGFSLTEMTTSGGHGCNEFVFNKSIEAPSPG